VFLDAARGRRFSELALLAQDAGRPLIAETPTDVEEIYLFRSVNGRSRQVVTLTFASWNQMHEWFKRLEALQQVALARVPLYS